MAAIWIGVAFVGSALFLIGLGRALRGLRPQRGMGGPPMTALETLAWVGVAVTGVIGTGLGVLIAVVGVTDFHEERARFAFWIMLILGIGVWASAWRVLKQRAGRVVADERDRAILARSFSVESTVVLLSLVAWTVALTEAFWEEGTVPIAYIQLVFWTTLIGGALGRSLGIVLGYHREIETDA